MAMTGLEQLIYEAEQELWCGVDVVMDVLNISREQATISFYAALESELHDLAVKINGNTPNSYCTDDMKLIASYHAMRKILNERTSAQQ